MQYPVPQFTEVEDKLIGPLSIKQFFILFGAGVLVFGLYSATKSMFVMIFSVIIFGLPALGLAFAKINGRPAYRQLPFLLKFFTAPKVLVFHKEASGFGASTKIKNAEISAKETKTEPPKADTQTRLREVQGILKKQQEEESELIHKI